MRILSFGSLNIDHVCSVKRIVSPGETIASTKMTTGCGGKGLNQSIALARAGMEVSHAGKIGKDGKILLDVLAGAGVDTSLISRMEEKSGYTFIQVDDAGQNSIVLYGGANREITEEDVDAVLERYAGDGLLLLQNEISSLEYLIRRAGEKGMRIILNPSPMGEALAKMDLQGVALFLLNEIEGEQMTGEKEPEKILAKMAEKYPDASVVLTLGKKGSMYRGKEGLYDQEALPVQAVDTTAAGDTFTGYFVQEYYETKNPVKALRMAAAAAALAVTKAGAAESIPCRESVLEWLKQN